MVEAPAREPPPMRSHHTYCSSCVSLSPSADAIPLYAVPSASHVCEMMATVAFALATVALASPYAAWVVLP